MRRLSCLAAAVVGCLRPVAPMLVAAPVAVAVVAMPGCSTPAKAYSTANETYIAAVRAILDLRAAGKIPEAKYQADILPQINRGDAILTAWRASLSNPGSPAPNIDLLREITRALLRYELEHRSTR